MPADVIDLRVPRRIHVVGVGGAGMSAVAGVLAQMGHRVSGSDLKRSAFVDHLQALGVAVYVGHEAAHVGDADVVTYSPAVPQSNPELVAAAANGAVILRRSQILAAISRTRRCIAVAGTHGKTTTASMLSLILVEAGMRPSFLIGADVNEVGTNAVFDSGEWLVLEADESYGTFATLEPEIAVVTNIEADHLDHYGTFDDLLGAFASFLTGAKEARIVGADDPAADSLGQNCDAESVGTSPPATHVIADVSLQRSAVEFSLHGPGADRETVITKFRVPVPGLHNVRNAAVAVVAASCAGAPLIAAVSALSRFAGVPRRFEFRGSVEGVTFVDDYAHLPNEVRAALAAGKSGGWDRIVAVFQPHRFTRVQALAPTFRDAFTDADLVVITDIFGAGEEPIPGVTGVRIADAVRASREVFYEPTREGLRRRLAGLLRPGDLCCTLGAGDLTSLPDEMLASAPWRAD